MDSTKNISDWERYCRDMYNRNQKERELWKEAAISYEEYTQNNIEFLQEQFNISRGLCYLQG